MKKLADAIHNCRSRPIIKADVMLNDEKVKRSSSLFKESLCWGGRAVAFIQHNQRSWVRTSACPWFFPRFFFLLSWCCRVNQQLLRCYKAWADRAHPVLVRAVLQNKNIDIQSCILTLALNYWVNITYSTKWLLYYSLRWHKGLQIFICKEILRRKASNPVFL